MLICSKKKFVFIHVEKTGGNSITQAWKDLMDLDLIPHWNPDGHAEKHWSADKIKEVFGFKDYFYFGFCRNPYDRLVSWYNFTKPYNFILGLDGHPQYQASDFDDHVKQTLQPGKEQRPLAQQCDLLKGVDLVARFEDYVKEYYSLCARFDINAPLPHINAPAEKVDWKEYYGDDVVKQLVLNYYKDDFKEFGYEE